MKVRYTDVGNFYGFKSPDVLLRLALKGYTQRSW